MSVPLLESLARFSEREVGVLGEVLAQQAIRVLVRATLPWTVSIGEEHFHTRLRREPYMIRQRQSNPLLRCRQGCQQWGSRLAIWLVLATLRRA